FTSSQKDILKLYQYNLSDGHVSSPRRVYGPGEPKKWDGPLARRMSHLAYVLMFWCLLRVDEALKIQSHDIVLTDCGKVSSSHFRLGKHTNTESLSSFGHSVHIKLIFAQSGHTQNF
ncbi:hypothetical protein B0H12DRAFT_1083412, partial [Mycena haematopus]